LKISAKKKTNRSGWQIRVMEGSVGGHGTVNPNGSLAGDGAWLGERKERRRAAEGMEREVGSPKIRIKELRLAEGQGGKTGTHFRKRGRRNSRGEEGPRRIKKRPQLFA